MKKLILAVMIIAAGAAETGGGFPTCGGAKGHECHCLRRTMALEEQFLENCAKEGHGPMECLRDAPKHCDLAAMDYGEGEGHEDDMPSMPHCWRACKPHDCKCNDGATCHIDHPMGAHRNRVW